MIAARGLRFIPAFSGASSAARSRHPGRAKQLQVRAMSAGPPKPAHWQLSYTYCDGVLEKRQPYREEHLALAGKAATEGKLTFGGLPSSEAGPPVGALFIFEKCSKEDVEAFAKGDPYVRNGIVTDWDIKPFLQIIGNGVNILPK